MKLRSALLATFFLSSSAFAAESIMVDMTKLQTGEAAGSVNISKHALGTVLTQDLRNLPTGGDAAVDDA